MRDVRLYPRALPEAEVRALYYATIDRRPQHAWDFSAATGLNDTGSGVGASGAGLGTGIGGARSGTGTSGASLSSTGTCG